MATQTSRSMISETSICNQALSWIGGSPIESLEDPIQAGRFCKANYPFLRDAVIEARFWSFARVRHVSTVADKPVSPSWGNQFLHSVPVDWLQVFYVYDDPHADRQIEGWTREGLTVYADYGTVYMAGVQRITDTGKFSNLFVQCLAARLAADLAMPIAGDRALQRDMWNLYEVKMAEAAARDGAQGRNQRIRSSTLVDARYNTGRRIGPRV
jgi:hypothetical protein